MSDFLKPIIYAINETISPLQVGFSNPNEVNLLFARYGWDLEVNYELLDSLREVVGIIQVLEQMLENINELVNSDSTDGLANVANTLQKTKSLIESLKAFKNLSTPSLPFPINQPIFWHEIGELLFEDLLGIYIEKKIPIVFGFLHLFGIIRFEKVEPVEEGRLTYTRTNIHWGQLLEFFTGPDKLVNRLYHWKEEEWHADWGTYNGFQYEKLITALERIFLANGLDVRKVLPRKTWVDNGWLASEAIRSFGIHELEIPVFNGITEEDNASVNIGLLLAPVSQDSISAPTGLMISPVLSGGVEHTIPLGSDMLLSLSGALDSEHSMVAKVFPNDVVFDSNLDDSEFFVKIALQGNPNSPWVLFGSEEGHRLELDGFEAFFILQSNLSDIEVKLAVGTGELNVETPAKLRVVIQLGDSDGFIQGVAGGESLKIEFASNLMWSSKTGITFEGQLGFEFIKMLHLQLGPINISSLYLSISANLEDEKARLNTNIGVGLVLTLGPFVAVVENVGVRFGLHPLEENEPPGAFGNLDLSLNFKPPVGIGLSLDTGAVRGGGYLFFDPDNESYGGALELEIQNTILVTAIGLITTRMPDGSKGFSLLLIINVQFMPGIVLGMGFFLSGLGGLIGINRTVEIEALRQGVRQGGINHIMFPENVVANISRIITDLRTVFPPKQDQFIIGLMAKITWGVPALLSVEFGLLIEFTNPFRIAILGVVKAVIPTEEAAILKLQVNFLGYIDFEKGELSFDASLEGSRILTFTLEGDMALRLSWGGKKVFVLSVGGFHPSFSPPAHLNLGSMKRLTLSILSGNPNLVLTSYFAITSNTVQFGAAIDFSFRVSKFSVIGYFGFDVLFQFSPFRFIAGIRAGIEIKLGSTTLFAITLAFELQGPTPWVAAGTASFKILFFKIKVRFSKTWGEEKTVMEPSVPVLPKVLEALGEGSNWVAELPANRHLLVSLNASELDEGEVLLQSMGSLKISQSVLPLGLNISKFGNTTPQDIKQARIRKVRIGGDDVNVRQVKDAFVPAAFKDMEDADKLSAPSYVDETSGVKVSDTEDLQLNYAINRPVEYEVKVSDYDRGSEFPYELYSPLRGDRWQDATSVFSKMMRGGAICKSPLAQINRNQKQQLSGSKVRIVDEPFRIVNTANLKQDDTSEFISGTKAEADQILKQIYAQEPHKRGKFQVIGVDELEEVL